MSSDAYLERLGRAHGFTLEELRANLQGLLHPAQQARGLRQGRVAVVVLAVLGVVALAGGLVGAELFRASLGASPSAVDVNAVHAIRFVAVLLAFVLLLAARASRKRGRARRAAFALGQIEVLHGPLNKIHVRGRGMPDRYRFQVGPRSFDTSKALWQLLTQGAAYRLHCVDDQLLSLAPLLDDPAERAEYEREAAQFERTRHVKPSKRVK